jgi:hypothetical protein
MEHGYQSELRLSWLVAGYCFVRAVEVAFNTAKEIERGRPKDTYVLLETLPRLSKAIMSYFTPLLPHFSCEQLHTSTALSSVLSGLS